MRRKWISLLFIPNHQSLLVYTLLDRGQGTHPKICVLAASLWSACWVMAIVTQQWGLAGLLLGTDIWVLLRESREPQGAAPAIPLLACQGRFTDLAFELQGRWCTAGVARGLPASSLLRRDNLEACQQSNLEKDVNLGQNKKGKCKWRKPAACIDCAGIWPWV